MSLGYGWCANLLLSDNCAAAYSYHTYDLSLPREKNGWGLAEDDGLIWVYVVEDGYLEIELEKASAYCSESGVYSAESLFLKCAHGIETRYQDEGTFPSRVFGDV